MANNKKLPSGGIYKLSLYIFGISLLVTLILLAMGKSSATGPFAILLFASFAIYARSHRIFSGFTFTIWVAAFVASAMYFPSAYSTWGGFELKILIVPLIQIIMFGMGTTLTGQDFLRVFTMPRAVLIGIILQFTIMPFVGKSLAMIFKFEPQIAAGVVLIGSCPGGVASNLMTYLAGGNVALSVTMTSCSTLLAPIMTPAMMKLLAGTYVPVPFITMMIAIIKMIIVPIVAGLVVNYTLTRLREHGNERAAAVSNAIFKSLPYISMFGICFIIGIITALSRDKLLGGSLIFFIMSAAIIHNIMGYILGYWGAWLMKLDESSCRTVAIEVGLQNGGMASGLAINTLKSELAALAPAIFGPWMNMSGAMLASWWSNKPLKSSAPERESEAAVS